MPLQSSSLMLTFDVSNAIQQHDCFIWLQRHGEGLEG